MAKERNLPIDHKWHDRTQLGPKAENHVYVDGEYIPTVYQHQEYPKFKYHPDLVAEPKEGVNYSFTQMPQLVGSEEEEKALGKEWKDTPSEVGVITAPDQVLLQKRRQAQAATGSNWRAALPGANPNLTEMHLKFLQDNGVEAKTMADLYNFLAGLTSTQMNSFMQDAQKWEKEQKPVKK